MKKFGVGWIACVAAVVWATQASAGVAVNGTLFYTTFNGGQNVWKVDYNYDGNTAFSLSNDTNIASTNGADGIIFSTNGNLLVGGQNSGLVHEVTSGGVVANSRATNTGQSFHLALNPNNAQNGAGAVVWSTGIPGTLSSLALTGGALLSNGVAHAITNAATGSPYAITSLAFDLAGKAYFTSSGGGGVGDFGTIDLNTFQATVIQSNLPAAHGMQFDPFTGDLVLFGSNHISQIATGALGVLKSDLTLVGNNFDQGAVDGFGHMYVADNNGKLFFMDYTNAGLVGDASNFIYNKFFKAFLDDIAPIAGPGGSNTVPEPTSLAIWAGLGLAGAAVSLMRRS